MMTGDLVATLSSTLWRHWSAYSWHQEEVVETASEKGESSHCNSSVNFLNFQLVLKSTRVKASLNPLFVIVPKSFSDRCISLHKESQPCYKKTAEKTHFKNKQGLKSKRKDPRYSMGVDS